MQNEQNNTVTVIFKSKVDIEFDGEKFDFDENKKYEISKNKLESLPSDILAKLTVESFWANIRFVSQIKIEEMNKIKQGNRYYFSRYNNNLANCVIQLVKKHTDAAFEYLIAKRRLTEEKNIYFTPEEPEGSIRRNGSPIGKVLLKERKNRVMGANYRFQIIKELEPILNKVAIPSVKVKVYGESEYEDDIDNMYKCSLFSLGDDEYKLVMEPFNGIKYT